MPARPVQSFFAKKIYLKWSFLLFSILPIPAFPLQFHGIRKNLTKPGLGSACLFEKKLLETAQGSRLGHAAFFS
jgi:hypothetical protein